MNQVLDPAVLLDEKAALGQSINEIETDLALKNKAIRSGLLLTVEEINRVTWMKYKLKANKSRLSEIKRLLAEYRQAHRVLHPSPELSR